MKQQSLIECGAQGSATIEGSHRYLLSRWWGAGARLLVCGINPSKADADDNDHTVSKLVGFTKLWGFDGFDLVNLFSWIATDWREMAANRAHAANTRTDNVIRELATAAPVTLAAWGRYVGRPWVLGRASTVLNLLWCAGSRIECLGTNRDGSPRHPLMLSYATPREEYAP